MLRPLGVLLLTFFALIFVLICTTVGMALSDASVKSTAFPGGIFESPKFAYL